MKNNDQTLIILHHPAQKQQAQHIAEELRLAPFRVVLSDHCPEDIPDTSHLLVLISSNFLYELNCMMHAPDLLSRFAQSNQLTTVVTPGIYQTEDGEIKTKETEISRAKDFIYYINYWQERYLELRKQKREAPPDKKEQIEEQLKSVRNISTNMGNFFNFLRKQEIYKPEELRQNSYEKLFNALHQTEEEHLAFAKKLQNHDTETTQIEDPEGPVKQTDEAEEIPGSPEEIPGLQPVLQGEVDSEPEEESEHSPKTDKENEEKEHSDQEGQDTESDAETPETKESKQKEYSVEELLAKARELRERDATEEALQVLEQGIQQQPEAAELRYQYALLLISVRKDAQTACAQLKKAVKAAPQRTDIHFLLAELLEYLDERRKALKHYQIVVRQEPEQAEAWHRLALLYANFFPEKQKAGITYKQAAKYKPEDAELQYLYAQHLLAQGAKTKKIIKALKEVLHRDRQHGAAHFQLARIYLKKGKKDKAQAHYLIASRLQPELRNEKNDKSFLQQKEKTRKPDPEEQTHKPEKAFGESPEKEKVEISPIALITGASSGIGRETARRFARAGYRLILCARRKDRLKLLQKELEDHYGIEAISLAFDLRQYEACKKAYEQLEGEWQNISVLVNNAGLARGLNPIHQGRIEDWDTMIDTNIKGLLYITRLVSPGMVERGHGHIINVGSTAGKEVYPNGNVYCATKFAVDALTKGMRIDLYKHGIKVGQVCPGHVETEFAKVRFDGDEEKAKIYEDFMPLQAEDVAELIYLLTTQPEHVNIQDVLVMAKQQAGSNFLDRSGR